MITPHLPADIKGQYVSDHFFHQGDASLDIDPVANKAQRGDGTIGFHSGSTLFDNEAVLPDEATGQVIRGPITINDEILALEGMRIVSSRERHRPDRKLDEAEQWLRDNDPNYGKK